jgi:predicted RNase H-like nuclease (RuvC/YqgF family)
MSARVQVDQYFAALNRLKARGAPISSDAVALEAGKVRGSIKSGRHAHGKLIEAIHEAREQQKQCKAASDPVPRLQRDVEELTRRLDESLDREVALLHELYDLRAKVNQFAEDNRQLKLGRLVPVR